MAKTVFSPGVVVTSTFLNAINNPVFDGQDLDGHFDKIPDSGLADGGIKSAVNSLTQSLLVVPATGTAVTVKSGSFTSLSGQVVSLIETGLSLPSDGVFFVYVKSDSQLGFGSVLPAVSLPLARVTTGGGSIANIQDLRPRLTVQPRANTIPVKGGFGSQKSLKVSTSGTPGWNVDNTEFTAIGTVGTPFQLSGQYDYQNFTIESGAKLVTNGLYLKVAGNCNIAGTIEVTPIINGGTGFNGSFLIPGDIYSNNGSGLGGSGGHSSAPLAYDWSVSQTGSGGGSSFVKGRLTGSGTFADISDNAQIQTGRGGKGGSFLKLEVAGTLSVAGTITAIGGNGVNTQYISDIGSNQFILASGSGGGSGGLVHLYSATSIELTPTCSISVNGGNGGVGHITTGFLAAYKVKGGGGGSGGYIVLHSPSITNNATSGLTLNGGLAGTDVGTGANTLSACPGASYGGNGGASGMAGLAGQLVLLNFG